jgi:hypothetical protein
VFIPALRHKNVPLEPDSVAARQVYAYDCVHIFVPPFRGTDCE